jgi:hypothetical protein
MMHKLDMLRKANSLDSSKLDGLFSRKNDSSRAKTGIGMGFELKGALQAAEKAVLTNHSQKFEEDLGARGAQEPHGAPSRNTIEAEGVEERVDRVHLLPIDWSLKEKAIFTSTLPFECFETSFNASPDVAHQALRAFTSGNRRSRSPNQMYLQSLLTWTFPLIPLQRQSRQQQQQEEERQIQKSKNSKSSHENGKSIEGLMLMCPERRERYHLWQEAFRDLLYSTYSGLCCAFYVLPPKGSSDRFVALFCCKNIQGRRKVSASFSHSSLGMRSKLKEDYGLVFSTPLMVGGGKHSINSTTTTSGLFGNRRRDQSRNVNPNDELEQGGNGGGGEGLTNKEESPETMLYFSGRENVHGLYDFLMNECGKTYHKGCDTPILMAPVPFEGASVKRFHPEYKNYKQNLYKVNKNWINGGSEKSEEGKREAREKLEEMGATQHFYQLHFTKEQHILPPWVVDRLCTTFRKTQNGQFEAKFEPVETTTKFNLSAVLLETEDEEYDARMESHSINTGGFWDTEESEKWFTHPGKLNHKCIRKVTSNKGIYHIHLK